MEASPSARLSAPCAHLGGRKQGTSQRGGLHARRSPRGWGRERPQPAKPQRVAPSGQFREEPGTISHNEKYLPSRGFLQVLTSPPKVPGQPRVLPRQRCLLKGSFPIERLEFQRAPQNWAGGGLGGVASATPGLAKLDSCFWG